VKEDRAAASVIVKDLIDTYTPFAEGKKSWQEKQRILLNEVLPAWGPRSVTSISRSDVRTLIENKAITSPVMANRLLAHISALFNFALERDIVRVNPAARMRKPGKEQSRTRVLSVDELKTLWTALHETRAVDDAGDPLPRLNASLNDLFLVLLLTAQRLGEVGKMQWCDVDLREAVWTIPPEDSKNGDGHRVPLTTTVMAVLERRQKHIAPPYVFSTVPGTNVAHRAKKAASTLSRGIGFAFRAHDLRRTATTYMAKAGVPAEHLAHVLNHRSVTRSSVTAMYNRYSYDEPKRAALEKWESLLLAVVGSAPARSPDTDTREPRESRDAP
jgi:integrase